MSKDGLTYEFVLRKGGKFHNGDPVTAEDIKFSFDRYRGAAAKLLKDRVKGIQIVNPGGVRFHRKEAWPDFMTFYGMAATGAAWIEHATHQGSPGPRSRGAGWAGTGVELARVGLWVRAAVADNL